MKTQPWVWFAIIALLITLFGLPGGAAAQGGVIDAQHEQRLLQEQRAPAACPPSVEFGCLFTGTGAWGWRVDNFSTANGAFSIYARLRSSTPGKDSAAVRGENLGTTGLGYGVLGTHEGSGIGVYGYSNNGVGFRGYSNTSVGMYGSTNGTANQSGVLGVHTATTGTGPGVRGQTNSTQASPGVLGQAIVTNPVSDTIGVQGINSSRSALGYGVWGTHAGAGVGVYGSSVNGRGVSGQSDNAAGVQGRSTSSDGVSGFSTFGNGVYADSFSSYGLSAFSSSGPAAIFARTGNPGNPAILGIASTPAGDASTVNTTEGVINGTNQGGGPGILGRGQDGVWGVGTERGVSGYGGEAGVGVYGRADGMDPMTEVVADGVLGASDVGNGVHGTSTDGVGIRGESTNTYGVHGTGATRGVYGNATSGTGTGVYGRGATGVNGLASSGGIGTRGEAPGASGWGVYGIAQDGTGVRASGGTYGIYATTGTDSTDFAGYFVGNVHITGSIAKSAGSFKIDHPLDPANQYLSHSFVESPDMMNVYNGNVTLDENGEAIVELPAYFEALNRDFRYQLTTIGGFAPVYIAETVKDNRFTIAGGTSGLVVSWQVTGIRQDLWANQNRIPVEEPKPETERGTYLYPAGYSQPASASVETVRDTQPQPDASDLESGSAVELLPMPPITQPQAPPSDNGQND